MAEEFDKKYPFSMPAEQSILGSILLDPNALNLVADKLTDEDFYVKEHKQIYSAMRSLFMANRNIDVVTLIDTLTSNGLWDKSSGENYIRGLIEGVPGNQNVEDYARIIRDKSILRKLIEASQEISESAYAEQDTVTHILDHAESTIFDIAQGRETKSFKRISDVIQDVYGHLKELNENAESTQGIKTQFSGIDKVLAGIGRSDFVIVGARPGIGKTSFCLNIASNVAKASKKTVCIFSLEMSSEELVSRMLSSEALIDSYHMRKGELTPEDWEHLAYAAADLSQTDILIDDTTGLTAMQMKAKLRRVKNLGLIVVDYLGLMSSEKNRENHVQEVSEITRSLKIMAKELKAPIICCAQLSRNAESRNMGKNTRPMLSDLRDSGSIEQDADVVMFLHADREARSQDATSQEMSIVEVIIAKNRHGNTGTIKMGWNGQYTKFLTIDDQGPAE